MIRINANSDSIK